MKTVDPVQAYRAIRKRCFLLGLLLWVALVLAVIFTLGMGAMDIPASSILRILSAKLRTAFFGPVGSPEALAGISSGMVAVVWELRLPRILLSILAGAGLAVAGVIFQGILQNPLADPYTLGISTGAAFGASLAIFFNITLGLLLPVSSAALVFAALTLALVLLIAQRSSGLVSANLIMAGIILSAILSAGISFLKMLSGENVGAIVFWLMGSLSAKGWNEALLLATVVPAALVLARIFAADLNILTLGSRSAESLGVQVKRTRLFYLFLGATISAVCVSTCGVIGFVGLIVPHLLRMAVTSDNRLLIPLSALLGGLLLCAADTFARLLSGGEIPVGVLTTLLGGPFFIFIFLRQKGGRGL
ncbi:HmuU protein [Treponema primitia ZAS-2]|uniref:HmuU protein n=1 Tax=Treponema primitia (strain ATCC BAA-887 / DSM 12427 / ZAS-2) TaxID=545694 RepID=F5YLB0_TREPZ|nr:iron ABC transporter permease [Treponema primitia]AEF86459.1 HmuU protein [Treponema primitia ZAS-2]